MNNNGINLDEQNRRLEDARLLRMEASLNDLTAKVNNGLSSRSKETIRTVKELLKTQHHLDKQVVENSGKAREMMHDITEIKVNIKSMMNFHQRGLISIILIMLTMGGWLFLHIDNISAFMDHVETDLRYATDHHRTTVALPELPLIEVMPLFPTPRPEEDPRPKPPRAIIDNHHNLKPKTNDFFNQFN